MTVKYLPEPDLCGRLVAGDEGAFRAVFDRFHRKIFQFAFKFLKDSSQSEEIVQDTFLNFWLHRATLDINQPIAPILFKIARNSVIDTWRKAASSEKFRQHVRSVAQPISNTTEEWVLVTDLQRMTDEVLATLSKQQQEVFALSRYNGLSYDEIAERLQISKHTVKYHLTTALKVLRAHFIKNDVLTFFFLVLFC